MKSNTRKDINKEQFDISAFNKPAKKVGGDFYDFFLIDKDHLAILIADVSGKGIGPGIFVILAKAFLEKHSRLNVSNPEKALTISNQRLFSRNEVEMFATVFLGILNIKTGEFVYSNAGHNPPLLKKKNGQFEWLPAKIDFVLGGLDDTQYTRNTIKIEPGDNLYFYTDGVTEAQDIAGTLYSEGKLRDLFNSLDTENMSSEEIIQKVVKDLDKFKGKAEQFDDITMIMLKIKKL